MVCSGWPIRPARSVVARLELAVMGAARDPVVAARLRALGAQPLLLRPNWPRLLGPGHREMPHVRMRVDETKADSLWLSCGRNAA
jgi:hypothetical protein